MTTPTTESDLVKRLKAEVNPGELGDVSRLNKEAAKRITELEAENSRLEAVVTILYRQRDALAQKETL